jgi:ATP-binding cassette subfamily F protein 3
MLTFRDLTYRIAGRVLLDHASATIPAGHKVGLVDLRRIADRNRRG